MDWEKSCTKILLGMGVCWPVGAVKGHQQTALANKGCVVVGELSMGLIHFWHGVLGGLMEECWL